LVNQEHYLNSYFAADVAEFIRQKLLETGLSFVFETVMSHESKLAFLQKAKEAGYRVYLYYVATEDPAINIQRVEQRVLQSGHDVPEDKIVGRYFKSLQLLKGAVKLSDRAYLFDTSDRNEKDNLFAEIKESNEVELFFEAPNWFYKYLAND
jgi:predicted ABC-type ATPase